MPTFSLLGYIITAQPSQKRNTKPRFWQFFLFFHFFKVLAGFCDRILHRGFAAWITAVRKE
jgi:hypothetical protein